jgi:hypothetical protein
VYDEKNPPSRSVAYVACAKTVVPLNASIMANTVISIRLNVDI